MDSTNKRAGGEVELLPFTDEQQVELNRLRRDGWHYVGDLCRKYARANVERALAESRAEVERLRGHLEANIHVRMLAVSEARDANALANKLESRAERLAGALRDAREYVASELSRERAAFKGYEHCSDVKSIEADLAKIDAALNLEPTP